MFVMKFLRFLRFLKFLKFIRFLIFLNLTQACRPITLLQKKLKLPPVIKTNPITSVVLLMMNMDTVTTTKTTYETIKNIQIK